MRDLYTSRVSSKRLISLPAEVARRLSVEPGDRLVWELREGEAIVRPMPRDLVRHLVGSLRHVYGEREAIERYLDEERRAWEGQS